MSFFFGLIIGCAAGYCAALFVREHPEVPGEIWSGIKSGVNALRGKKEEPK